MILSKPVSQSGAPPNLGGQPGNLIGTGQTGNLAANTTPVCRVKEKGGVTAIQFVVEAQGGTPTVTWQGQGSLDGVNWYNLAYITDASDTLSVAAITTVALGAQVIFLDNSTVRNYNFFRVIVSANTNTTYRAELWTDAGVD